MYYARAHNLDPLLSGLLHISASHGIATGVTHVPDGGPQPPLVEGKLAERPNMIVMHEPTPVEARPQS